MRPFYRLIIVAVVGAALVFGVLSIKNHNKIKLTLNVAPRAASVTLDGKPRTAGKSYYVSKGKHTVNATLQNFQSASQTVTVSKSTTVTMGLSPSNQAGTNYLLNNIDAQKQLQLIGDVGATKTQEILATKYPYLNQLPILTSNFTIYQAQPLQAEVPIGDAEIALKVVSYSPIDRARAVERIRQDLGIDPSSVEIIFVNQDNIFNTDYH
jgi:hypothetical protein